MADFLNQSQKSAMDESSSSSSSSGFLNQTQKIAQEQAAGGSNSKGFGPLVYTETHKQESGGLMLTFTEAEYKRANFGAVFSPKLTGTTIALPIPYNLDTNYSTTWNTPDNGAFSQKIANDGGQLLRNSINNQNLFSSLSKSDVKYESIMGALKEYGSALATDIVTDRKLFQVVGSGAGIARNPFLAQLFEGVQFRSFTMEFKMYPKSKEESDIIDKIIKAFKYGMHPSYQAIGSLKNALFNYPYIYKPEFSKPDYLFDFGWCIIKTVSPSYHDAGAPLYFEDNGKKIPAFVRLQIEFQELDIITKDILAGPDTTGSSR